MKKLLNFSIKIIVFCMSVFCLSVLPENLPMDTQATMREEKTVRVGFPLQAGLSMRDEYGNLSGYTYDYIMEISQYTGWNYEFVFFEGSLNEQLLQSMDMLKNGDIDLLGALYYEEALTADYAYPGYSYGFNYSGLFVPEHSSLREASLYNISNIKVGVHSKAGNNNQRLEQFAQMNDLQIEQMVTTSSGEYYSMLENGTVDALLSTDLAMAAQKDMYPITHFSPVPFYFATTKGNTEIIQQLDYALSTINQVNPDFTIHLYNQYFSRTPTNLTFTKEEMEYLETCGTLEVVMYDNKPPFQSVDPVTKKPVGITVEILEFIADNMNLELNYNTVSTYEDYISFIDSGRADIVADVFNNYQDARDTKSALTLPWYSLPISMVFNEGTEYSENGKIAAPYFLKNILPSKDNVTYFDTAEECLQAVQKGVVNYSFVGEFCSQYYFNMPEFSSLKRMNQSDIANQKLCFGIYNANSPYLHTIFNKIITILPKDTVSEIVYRNTYQMQELSFMDLAKRNKNLLFAVIMTLLALILTICFYIKNRQQRRISFENKRYNAISNLANEYFYEYDVLRDELTLSEKCADYFACQQKIPEFSKGLSLLTEAENRGIWQLGKYIVSREEGSFEQPCDMPDHTKQWFKIFSSAISNNKRQVLFVGKITNIQDIKSEQLLLKRQASLDGLTGVYNISAFKQLVGERLLKFDSHLPCALVILDIDNFKQINDSFGHYNGDIVLANTAKLVSNSITHGIYGRLGGDEFVAFVTNADKETLTAQCSIICDTMVKETMSLLNIPFSVSIGIAWGKEGQSYEELYKEADAALYKTKTTSKNGFSFFDDNIEPV